MIYRIIAMVSMLLDHIGFKYDIFIFRCIGRLALPIYAYYIVKHVFCCSDIRKYLIDVILVGLAAQLQYWLYFKIFQLNICFSWAFCIVCLYLIKRRHKFITRIVLSCVITFISLVLPFEGCIFAWLWCLIWYFGIYEKILENGNKENAFLCSVLSAGSVVLLCINGAIYYYCLSLFAIPFMCIKLPNIRSRWFKYVYHWFYPVHLFFLLFI